MVSGGRGTGGDFAEVEGLADVLHAGPDAPKLRGPFRERFTSLEDGRASERVVKAVFGV